MNELKFKIGDHVEIVGLDLVDIGYRFWAEGNNMLKWWPPSLSCQYSKTYRIIASGPHPGFRNINLYGLENEVGDQIIVEEMDLKHVN